MGRIDLTPDFERSASQVHSIVASFETYCLKPASTYAQQHPISMVYFSVLVLLSFIPASAFLLCTLFFLVSLVITGIAFAFITVLFLLSCFLFVVALNLFASAGFTVLVISTYLSLRFLVLVYHHGFGGISFWASEIYSHFDETRGREKASSETSESSMVLVDANEGTSDPTVKSEEK